MNDALRFVMSDWWHLTLSIAALTTGYSVVAGSVHGSLSTCMATDGRVVRWWMGEQWKRDVWDLRVRERVHQRLVNVGSLLWPVTALGIGVVAMVVLPTLALIGLGKATSRTVAGRLRRRRLPVATVHKEG